MKTLVSGSSSGLGKYIFEQFSGTAWTRNITGEAKKKLKDEGVDVIIHCAFNSNQTVDSNNLYDYLADNVLLTEELVNISHNKFILISSVDVYPKDKKFHKENEIIDVNKVNGMYGVTKLMSEAQVMQQSSNYLILRCSALLGKYSRKNSLIKIMEGTNELSLSGDSSFNYILHSDVLDFINHAIKNNLSGIYNVVTSENIILKEVADILKKQVNFGKYKYNVGNIDNSKIISIYPEFKKTSKEVILQFLRK